MQVLYSKPILATEGLGKDEVRISYCINQESLKKAMNILDQGLKQYLGRL